MLAHWSLRQKLNHVSSVQFSYVALYAPFHLVTMRRLRATDWRSHGALRVRALSPGAYSYSVTRISARNAPKHFIFSQIIRKNSILRHIPVPKPLSLFQREGCSRRHPSPALRPSSASLYIKILATPLLRTNGF